MPTSLLKYDSLSACDEYFDEIVSNGLLGDLEPGEGEIDHLSGLIAQELKNHSLSFKGSLSVAVFLVWMGWLHYQEGNYWGPVYQKLELSPAQIRWQGLLGEAFLQAVRKYNLHDFQGKLRYISPILAHGYVPNWHLESYFEDVLLEIYKDREKVELQIKKEEIEHLVSSWCSNYVGYEKYQRKMANIELAENKLSNIYEACKYKDTLLKLQSLQRKLIHKTELDELLTYPEGWLDKSEAEKAECKEKYNSLQDWIEGQQKIEATLRTKNAKLEVIEGDIKEVAGQIFEAWDENLIGLILNLPVSEISELARKNKNSLRITIGLRGWLLRFFAPAKYRRLCRDRQRLEELLAPLPVKQRLWANPWPILPQILPKLQDLLEQRDKVVSALAEINATQREAAATSEGLFVEDLEGLRNRLDRLTQELAGYKTKMVELGKGDLEKGKEILAEQRELLREITLLQAQIPGDTDALLNSLTMAQKYSDIKKLERRLTGIRKRKKETKEYLKIYRNPLYSLNESTRVFILQGEEKAVGFIYESLLLLDGLQKGKIDKEILLPNRIKQAMQHWWEQKGKSLLEKALEERISERELEADSVNIRKPKIKLDLVYKEIKVVLPRQPVREKAGARFYVQGESGQRQEMILPLISEKDIYWSEAAELLLEYPEPLYHLQFHCGNVIRSWQVKGVGWDSFCMLFDKQGELVTDEQLPEDGVYIVAPVGSSVDPVADIREQLSGHWSDYEYRYIDLENNDLVVVRTGEDVSIFRRSVKLKPMLLSRDTLYGITAEDAIVYQGQLPNLLFSISHPEEMQFYGVRLDAPGESAFKPLKELKTAISKDNVVYTSLAGLVKKKYGLFEIFLEKHGEILWSEQCVVIPDLRLIFDRKAYTIQDNSKETGRLEFNSKHKCEFIPDGSASAAIRPISSSTVEFDTSQNVIQGSLVYHFEQKLALEIKVQVPGIRWRRVGAEWKAETEEVWHEELGNIEVMVPGTVGKSIELSLGRNRQVISSQVRQGIAAFSLRRFSDTLRESNEPLEEIILTCTNTELPSFVLLRVRMRWQAAKVSLTQRLQGGNRHLLVEWEDLGRATNRVVRLWPLNMPEINHIEKAIPDGISSLDLTAPVELMPPGRYRLQLIVADPWSSSIVSIPEQAAENCKDVDIGTKEEQLKRYLGKRLEVIALYHEEQEIKPEIYYWLEVTELNPTFEEEVRLMGNVYSFATDGTIEGMPFNPVSFYISDHKMPFLIDKDGDGVTYCRKCKVMFWEVAHKECGDAVFVPDIILVRVRDK